MDKQFHIFEITKEVVEVLRAKSEEAHFHDFEEIIVVTQGSLEHYIDFQVEVSQAPFISYVSQGKMHRIIEDPELRGWVINYQNEFIPNSKLSFYSNFITATNIPISTVGCTNNFDVLCQVIHAEYSRETLDFSTIRHLITGLISMIEAERKRNMPGAL